MVTKLSRILGPKISCKFTANLRMNIMDFRGFDSSMFLILRGGILVSARDSRKAWIKQSILVRIMLGRLGVRLVWTVALPQVLDAYINIVLIIIQIMILPLNEQIPNSTNHVCMYIYIHTHIHIHMHTRVHVYIYIYI